MALTVLSGMATKVTLGSDFSYAATANHGPVAIKNQLVSMRIDGKPVMFRTRTLPSISDGDVVAASGPDKGGELEALALRNMTTGVIYAPATVMPIILSILLIVLGVPLIAFIGFGLIFIGFGVFVLLRVLRVRKATAMLQALPAAVAAPS